MNTIGITTEKIDKKINSKIEPPDDYRDSIFNSGFERGFYNGAKWRITDIWHKPSEMPKNEWIIVLVRANTDNGHFTSVEPKTCKKAGYEILLNEGEERIVAWAYVADLIPVFKSETFIESIGGHPVEINYFTTGLPGEETVALI